MGKAKKRDNKNNPTRREVLLKGAALLPYVVPVIDSVRVGLAEAAHQGSRGNPGQGGGRARGRPSCPPGQVMRFGQFYPVPRGGAKSSSSSNDYWK